MIPLGAPSHGALRAVGYPVFAAKVTALSFAMVSLYRYIAPDRVRIFSSLELPS